MRPGRTDAGGDRYAGEIGGGKGYVSCCLLFSILLIHVFFSLFFCSNCLQYNNRRGRAGQDVTGPTRAGTLRESNKGQGRGAGRREEEGDGWAGVLVRGRM